VLRFLEAGQSRLFKTVIDTEFRASYFQLQEQRLHIEVWDKENFWLNRFLGYMSIPLIDIVNGSFRQSASLAVVDNKGVTKTNAELTFSIYFEEIWDFHLTFLDWKTSNLTN